MENRAEPKAVIKFGLYEVDPVDGSLRRQGALIRLQEQPFRILVLLLQRPHEIVTREELRQALWPEGTHVNFDGSLNAALKKLRAALQDDADNPRFVETVPRQGYRFLAPVQVVGPIPEAVPGAAEPDEAFEVKMSLQPEFSPARSAQMHREKRKAARNTRWVEQSVLISAILVGSWLLFFLVYPVARPSVQRMTRITNAGGIDEWGGIVSDGTRIFFLEREGGRWELMQTSVEGGSAEKMPAPFENTRLFAISPDHSQFIIGQFTRRDEEMPLWLWPVQGGTPRRIGEVIGRDPAWSPDGSQIILVHGRSLYTIHADGTQLRELAKPNGQPHSPAWSVDSGKIRFTVEQRDSQTQSLWEILPDGNGMHALISSSVHPTSQSMGQWTSDGRYFLFSGCEKYDCNLWAMREAWNWFRRSHHAPVQLTQGPDSLHVSIPSQVGSRVFAFSFHSDRELRRIVPGDKAPSELLRNISADETVVSPDGKLALYIDRADGALWRTNANGRGSLRLTKRPLVASAPHWSRDGKNILFTGNEPGQPRQIYLLAADGGALRPVLPAEREASSADWSPDGSQIVVSMRDQKTQPKFGIYLFKPSTSEWTLLPDSRGMSEPRWSPDGRYIVALDDSNHQLSLYDFQTQNWRALAKGGLLGAAYWSASGDEVYYQDQSDDEESVFKISINDARVQKVFGFGEILRGNPTHCVLNGVNADGSLYVMVERGLTDIYALDLDLP